jgi:hypothetical protein
LVFETFDEALSGLTVVVFFAGFSSGSRKSSARFLVDLVVLAGASSLTSFLALVAVVVVVSVFLRADFGAGFSTVVVLTFLVVTLGSDAPVA